MQKGQLIWAFLYQATRGLQIGALPQGGAGNQWSNPKRDAISFCQKCCEKK